jgi:hypothetical protein
MMAKARFAVSTLQVQHFAIILTMRSTATSVSNREATLGDDDSTAVAFVRRLDYHRR